MEFNNLKEYLAKIGTKIVADAKQNLAAQDHDYTGRLKRSIKYKVVEKGKMISLNVRGLKYGLVLDQGFSGYLTKRDTDYTIKASRASRSYIRGNTVYTPWQDIQKWVKAKGIGGKDWKSAAYLINRHIKLHGRRPSKWLEKAKNKNIRTKTYRQGVRNAVMQDIKEHYRTMKYLRK